MKYVFIIFVVWDKLVLLNIWKSEFEFDNILFDSGIGGSDDGKV